MKARDATACRVLYITHNGLTEPLGQRQVLPYLIGLAARGWRFTVVSFEKPQTATADAVARIAGTLERAGVLWKRLRYHKRPPLLSTAYDVLQGWKAGTSLQPGFGLVHARSTVPALMAKLLSRGRPWIFDLRGLVAEEYADAGHWPRKSLRYRVTRAAERELLRSADGLVTLTRSVERHLPDPRAAGSDRPSIVIPCSVDLEEFRPSEVWRREVRGSLGWGDEPALVYSGSLGSWYRLGEMLDFFETARQEMKDLRLLLLTPHTEMATDATRIRGLEAVVTTRTLTPDAVPRHLAACDGGICFLGRHASKVASSPTKYGEYLAAGLPVVTNGWIGDAAALAPEPSWILVDDFTQAAYARATKRLTQLLSSPASARSFARQLAHREFALEAAIDHYDALYRRVLMR